MGFFFLSSSCFIAFFTSLFFCYSCRIKPPQRWGEKPYSNSKFANLFKKIFRDEKLKIDKFHLYSFYFFSLLFFLSTVILVIDIIIDMKISEYLGIILVIILSMSVLVILLLYEAFLTIWWEVIRNKDKEDDDIVKLKKILKEKEIKNKNKK